MLLLLFSQANTSVSTDAIPAVAMAVVMGSMMAR